MRRLLGALSASALPLAVAAAAFTLAVGLPAGDPDMWWHLASGRWMVEHRDALRVDVFSSTATGEPYALGQWLGEVVLYLAYAGGSWLGVAILRAVLVALAAFAVTRLALRAAPARVAIPLAALALLLSKPTWTDRPQLFTLALFPLLLEVCLVARGGSRAALIATVPLVAVWAELHGGYALGIALLWIFALAALLERRPLAGPLAAAAIATFVVSAEPGPLTLLGAAGHVAGSTVRIAEESPVDPLTPFGALFALFVGASLAAFMLRGGSLLGALVLVPMLWLALTAQRHVPLFGFAAVPFLAGPLTSVASDVATTVRRSWPFTRSSAASRWAGAASAFRSSHQIDAGPHRSDAGPRKLLREMLRGSSGTPLGRAHFLDRSGPHLNRSGSDLAPPSEQPGAGATSATVRAPTSTEPPTSSRSFARPWLPTGIAAALWAGALASIATATPTPDLRPYPTGAREALASSSGILLNEYDWGGYLIWSVPGRPVFVDGRLFPFAGNGVIAAYQTAILVLPGWRGVIERWNVAQALLLPDRPLAQTLRDDGWTVRAQGERFVLLERPR